MKYAVALLLALLPALAHADVVFNYETGQTLYVRFDDASNTAVDLTEGSTLKEGRYTAADAAIDSAGLAAGTYTGRVFIGTAGAQSSSDVIVGVLPEFIFGASTQTTSYQNMLAQIVASTPLAAFFDNQPEASVTLDAGDIEDIVDALIAAGAVAAPVDADVVDDSRTWFATDYRARNIVTVGDNFAGTLALQPDLNPGSTIASVNSVSITGAATVTATDLSLNRAKTRAHFTVPTLTTTGTYTVVVTVTTVDGQTIPTTATLKVQ